MSIRPLLSPRMLKRLDQAIQRARLPGVPVYVDGAEPACVIAQLAAIEGVDAERMATWKGGVRAIVSRVPELQPYPILLLDRLQLAWSNPLGSEDAMRRRMRWRVDEWLSDPDARRA